MECLMMATECALSRNNGNSALIAAGGITAFWMSAWSAAQDTKSILSNCCFLRAAITVLSQSDSASAARATVCRLGGLTGPWYSELLGLQGSWCCREESLTHFWCTHNVIHPKTLADPIGYVRGQLQETVI